MSEFVQRLQEIRSGTVIPKPGSVQSPSPEQAGSASSNHCIVNSPFSLSRSNAVFHPGTWSWVSPRNCQPEYYDAETLVPAVRTQFQPGMRRRNPDPTTADP